MFTATPYEATASSTRMMPHASVPSSRAVGMPMKQIPANPTRTPANRRPVVPNRNIDHPMSTVNNGIAALSIPVMDELIHCCAIGNMLSGNAIQKNPSAATLGQADRGSGTREPGTARRARKPKATRNHVTMPGSKDSSASAVKRKLDPQIAAGARSSSQSSVVNGRAAAVVTGSR